MKYLLLVLILTLLSATFGLGYWQGYYSECPNSTITFGDVVFTLPCHSKAHFYFEPSKDCVLQKYEMKYVE